MPEFAIESGDKLHIVTRRLFHEDVRRHFVGEVVAVTGYLVEVRGYPFVFNTAINEYQKIPETRTRVFSLGDSGHIVNLIPRDVDIDAVAYRATEPGLVVTDGQSFSMAINEFGPKN